MYILYTTYGYFLYIRRNYKEIYYCNCIYDNMSLIKPIAKAFVLSNLLWFNMRKDELR